MTNLATVATLKWIARLSASSTCLSNLVTSTRRFDTQEMTAFDGIISSRAHKSLSQHAIGLLND